jgi:hypothetical protein
MMDPLLDEYNSKSGSKGTELKALDIAVGKARDFTKKLFIISFVFLAIDIVQKCL